MSEDLFTRIQRVCSFHEGSDWKLGYSSDDNTWAFQLVLPDLDDNGEEKERSMMDRFFYGPRGNANFPAFAMRCQTLEVLAEALEHWHATLVTKDAP